MFVVSSIYDNNMKEYINSVRGIMAGSYSFCIEDYDTGEVHENVAFVTLIKVEIFGKLKFSQRSKQFDYLCVTTKVQWDFLRVTNGFKRVVDITPNSVEIEADKTVTFFFHSDEIVKIHSILDPMHILDFYQFIVESGVHNGVDAIYITHSSKLYKLDWNKSIELFVTKSLMLKGRFDYKMVHLKRVGNNRYKIAT